MTTTSRIPHGRSFTVDDLEVMPEDGNRYELIDGTLFVGPAPDRRHQRTLLKIAIALEAACPDDMHVLIAPFAVRESTSTEVLPYVLVGRDGDFTDKLLPVAPLLAVEVLWPSSTLSTCTPRRPFTSVWARPVIGWSIRSSRV